MAVLGVRSMIPAIIVFGNVLRSCWYLSIPLALIIRFLYFKYRSPLRQYPGPFLASGSRAWKGAQECDVPSVRLDSLLIYLSLLSLEHLVWPHRDRSYQNPREVWTGSQNRA